MIHADPILLKNVFDPLIVLVINFGLDHVAVRDVKVRGIDKVKQLSDFQRRHADILKIILEVLNFNEIFLSVFPEALSSNSRSIDTVHSALMEHLRPKLFHLIANTIYDLLVLF